VNKTDFEKCLRAEILATDLIQGLTNIKPNIVTIAETEGALYTRFGIMMAGDKMCALVILSIYPYRVGQDNMERIRDGEPAGAVLKGMKRHQGNVKVHAKSIESYATLELDGMEIGIAQEIFTESMFDD
jgi:hypothetical protein